ncbi:MAG TPA: winged helix-turn-helix domain-containing protein [Vicinamibacterales bacterium]|nr:winged helix-turn-helix domain-containing protein [Vicinamibacterales bacterium]
MKRVGVGEWTVEPALNRLTRGTEEVRLEPKVMQVLETLADAAGDVVTRDALVAKVWPDVHVSDDVLHRAIRELRRAFGDDTANPAYVETIRKRGYRLIAPVRSLEPEPVAAPAARRGSRKLVAAASILLAATLGAVVVALATRPDVDPSASPAVRFVAMTSGPLNETDPALSPDGSQLAFAMRPDPSDHGHADIFITRAAGQTPERIIASPVDDRYPAWSPDATTLAFVRIDGRTCDVIVATLADKRERRLVACGNAEEPRVNWSPDGEWLVESFAPGPDPIRGWRIARIATRTGIREELTLPAPGTLGDYSPVVSPDGSRIAFVRGINGATSDIFVMPFAGGTPTRLTWDNQDIVGIDWSADGQSLVYATDRAGGYTIWRAAIAGGAPQLVVGGAAKLKHPAVSRASGHVTYESWSYEINLWETPVAERLDLEGDLTATLRPAVQTSDQWNHSPDLSPDGSRVAFISTRSGGAELWIADRNGANAKQLTTFGRAYLRPPRWSPDGSRILISASVSGRLDLYVVDAPTAALTRLTDDDDDEIAPSWSHDGNAVLFGARRAGTWQVMRLAVADRSRTQLTIDGGYAAQPSPDGSRIFFTRLERPGVWVMPAAGGEAELLVPGVRAAETANWRATATGIYYIGATSNQPVVRRAPLDGGNGVDVAWLGNYSWPGFAVTPDGTRVVYAHWDRRDSNIMAMQR